MQSFKLNGYTLLLAGALLIPQGCARRGSVKSVENQNLLLQGTVTKQAEELESLIRHYKKAIPAILSRQNQILGRIDALDQKLVITEIEYAQIMNQLAELSDLLDQLISGQAQGYPKAGTTKAQSQNTIQRSSIYSRIPSTRPRRSGSGPSVAENYDRRNADNDGDGRIEPIYVQGYYRKDGTYVRGHYRARRR